MTTNYSPAFIEHLLEHYRRDLITIATLKLEHQQIRTILFLMQAVVRNNEDATSDERSVVDDMYQRTISHLDALWKLAKEEAEIARLVQSVWYEYEDTSACNNHVE